MATKRPYPDEKYKYYYMRPKRKRRSGGFVLLLLAVCALVVITQSRKFVVSEISVTGNSKRTVSEIAGLSGIEMGMSIFKVDEKAIARNFLSDSYVELVSVEIEYPDKVEIEVRERAVWAAVNNAGVILLIDQEGCILERVTSLPDGVIVISGLDVSVNSLSKYVESRTAGQISLMKKLLSALKEEQTAELISELNLSNPDNIYLVSQSGIQVIIGDDAQLPVKLVWMKAVLEELTKNGIMKGVLDVSSGKNAVYSEH